MTGNSEQTTNPTPATTTRDPLRDAKPEQSNPFVSDDGNIQATVSVCQQSLSILHNVLWTGDAETVELDFDYRCGLVAVVEGIDDALKHVVDELDNYKKREEAKS